MASKKAYRTMADKNPYKIETVVEHEGRLLRYTTSYKTLKSAERKFDEKVRDFGGKRAHGELDAYRVILIHENKELRFAQA